MCSFSCRETLQWRGQYVARGCYFEGGMPSRGVQEGQEGPAEPGTVFDSVTGWATKTGREAKAFDRMPRLEPRECATRPRNGRMTRPRRRPTSRHRHLFKIPRRSQSRFRTWSGAADTSARATMNNVDDGRTDSGTRKERRGFASMSPEKQREIASKGGRAAHEKGTAHEWTSEEARSAGRKGGQISRGGRGSPDRRVSG